MYLADRCILKYMLTGIKVYYIHYLVFYMSDFALPLVKKTYHLAGYSSIYYVVFAKIYLKTCNISDVWFFFTLVNRDICNDYFDPAVFCCN